ncbi:uncharacterized protein LOC133795633 [Humulus lupulus]|uniref:uncharacterized protein LOC133795633 n=1 Tax=Humulus lupulus TaxID=3486 RepID=UPI002B416CDC|nr:uncharacterized protein LOC133795633 [Humulus lupulus]
MQKMKNFGSSSCSGGNMSSNGRQSVEEINDDDNDHQEISRLAISTFQAREEEIERRKMEVKEKVELQLGRAEEETKRLARIREEKEYKEALDLFNEKSKEKAQLVSALKEKNWDTVKGDLMNVLEGFFKDGIIQERANETYICLIPKKINSCRVKDYRPISLVTSLYKIISKVLACRLRGVLADTIADSQGAFVEGRQILDTVLVANEAVEEYRSKGKKGWVFKIDFTKAYDCVDWGFLDFVLQKKGFGEVWRRWMQGCLSSTSFSVFLNGRPRGKFKGSRGLRQGDSLSPFLFTLVVDVLGRMIDRAKSSLAYRGFTVGSDGVDVSHLQFADDTIFFVNDDESLGVLLDILKVFSEVSGLSINLQKCQLLGINLPEEVVDLRNVARSIEKVMRDFLWEGADGSGDDHLVSWQEVCKSRNYGGLGIGNIEKRNKAFLMKWLWRFPLERKALWYKVVKSRYGLDEGHWDTGGGRRLSVRGPWRDITALYEEYRKMVCFKVGKGDRIQFWEDVWLGEDTLKSRFSDLFLVSMAKNCAIKDLAVLGGEGRGGSLGWNLRFRRNLLDREVANFAQLMHMLQVVTLPSILEDRRNWNSDTSGVFNCKSAFHSLSYAHLGPELDWAKFLWRSVAPYKVKLFGWLLFLDKVSVHENLQRRRPFHIFRQIGASAVKMK